MLFLGEGDRVIEHQSNGIASSFGGAVHTGVVDQNPAHHASRYRKEMDAILPVNVAATDQPQIGLMHQGSTLQGLIARLAGETATRHLAKFVINQRNELLASIVLPLTPAREQLRDPVRRDQVGLHLPNASGFTNYGKLTVNAGSVLTVNSIFGPFNNLVGGTLTGGTYAVTGMLDIGGAITANTASITLTGASADVLNTSAGTNALANLGANTTKGELSLQSGQALTTFTNFSNAGKSTVGAGSSFTVGGSYTQTAGTTTVDGTLTAPTGLNLQKGTLEGKGTLAAAISSTGTVVVGDSTSKAGVLTVTGSYSQQASGVVDMAIGGTTIGSQYSQMAVSNGVGLDGTLTIKLINSFVPTIGDTFTILTGSAVTGQFTKVTGSNINSGEHFEVNYTPTAVTLTVVSGA